MKRSNIGFFCDPSLFVGTFEVVTETFALCEAE